MFVIPPRRRATVACGLTAALAMGLSACGGTAVDDVADPSSSPTPGAPVTAPQSASASPSATASTPTPTDTAATTSSEKPKPLSVPQPTHTFGYNQYCVELVDTDLDTGVVTYRVWVDRYPNPDRTLSGQTYRSATTKGGTEVAISSSTTSSSTVVGDYRQSLKFLANRKGEVMDVIIDGGRLTSLRTVPVKDGAETHHGCPVFD